MSILHTIDETPEVGRWIVEVVATDDNPLVVVDAYYWTKASSIDDFYAKTTHWFYLDEAAQLLQAMPQVCRGFDYPRETFSFCEGESVELSPIHPLAQLLRVASALQNPPVHVDPAQFEDANGWVKVENAKEWADAKGFDGYTKVVRHFDNGSVNEGELQAAWKLPAITHVRALTERDKPEVQNG